MRRAFVGDCVCVLLESKARPSAHLSRAARSHHEMGCTWGFIVCSSRIALITHLIIGHLIIGSNRILSAAGIGAGKRLPGWSSYGCSRYNSSYPHYLHSQSNFGTNETSFEFLACSGATSEQIFRTQIPKLSAKGTYDLLTLSAGGNDVGLAEVLNACIYQWSGGDDAVCEAQLEQTSHLIKTQLHQNMDKLHDALTPYVAPNGKLYHTGYAKFFDVTDKSCDNVTWSFWYADKLKWKKQYLTQARRRQMNTLVDAANIVIRKSVERAQTNGDRNDIVYRFIDYDPVFDQVNGRFCTPGVQEPAPNRPNLLFYEWDTSDSRHEAEHGVDGLDPEDVTEGTFEGRIVDWIEEAKRKHPDAVAAAYPADGYVGQRSLLIPDGYLRVFHPRPRGHEIVAEKIMRALMEDQQNLTAQTAQSGRPELR
jgi:lysophospholipase L1-like esterase